MRKHDAIAMFIDGETFAPLDVYELDPRFNRSRDIDGTVAAIRRQDRLRRRLAKRAKVIRPRAERVETNLDDVVPQRQRADRGDRGVRGFFVDCDDQANDARG